LTDLFYRPLCVVLCSEAADNSLFFSINSTGRLAHGRSSQQTSCLIAL